MKITERLRRRFIDVKSRIAPAGKLAGKILKVIALDANYFLNFIFQAAALSIGISLLFSIDWNSSEWYYAALKPLSIFGLLIASTLYAKISITKTTKQKSE